MDEIRILVNYGFSTDDIQAMGFAQKNYILQEIIVEQNNKRLSDVMNFAEAVRLANASISPHIKNGRGLYTKWYNRLKFRMRRKQKKNDKTVWDDLKIQRKKPSFKIN